MGRRSSKLVVLGAAVFVAGAGLGFIGLRQSLSEGLGLSQVPGYVLLWYAFDSFWKFHQQTRLGAPPDGPSGNGTAA